MTEKRMRYYVVHASAQENEQGRYHFSKPFVELETAKSHAEKIQDDFVVIEKRHEMRLPPPAGFVYRKPEQGWEVDHETGGIETID